MKGIICSISILFITFSLLISAKAQALIDLETGLVFTGRNDVRIPGDQSTLFSLKDDLISKTAFFYRIRLGYTIKSRHTISLLYAPWKQNQKGLWHRIFCLKVSYFRPIQNLKEPINSIHTG